MTQLNNLLDILNTPNLWTAIQTLEGDTKLQFRDTDIFIHSNDDGELTIEADSKVTIGVAGDIELGDGTLREMRPETTDKIDLGSSSKKFNDLHLAGDATIGGSLTWCDYCSVTTTADATTSTSEYDIFDEDNYAAWGSTANVTARNITFDEADGTFTVANTGIYEVTLVLISNGSSGLLDISIHVDGADKWKYQIYQHSSVDPVMSTVSVILSLTAAEYVNFLIDGAATVVAKAGCTANIKRIA